MTPSMSIDGAHGRLHVRRWLGEEPTRYVVVVAHGWGEHGGRYADVAERLLEERAAVYAPDHAGHGHSYGVRGLVDDPEDLVDDLGLVVAYARTRHPGDPLVLLGHAMGGVVATRYVQRRPTDVTALVLSAPLVGGTASADRLLRAEPMPRASIDPSLLSRDPLVAVDYASDPLVHHGPVGRPTIAALVAAVEAIARGGRLTVPTLWLHGTEDRLAPLALARPALARIRSGVFVERIYAGARHDLFNEINRDDVLADLLGFVGATVEPHLVPSQAGAR